IVVDHCGTTMLEGLAADMPTVLFWDPTRWEMRPSAENDFEALRDAGILYTNPEAAAVHIRDVYNDPYAWWHKPSVRKAVRQFISLHGMTSAHWATDCVRILVSELTGPRAAGQRGQSTADPY